MTTILVTTVRVEGKRYDTRNVEQMAEFRRIYCHRRDDGTQMVMDARAGDTVVIGVGDRLDELTLLSCPKRAKREGVHIRPSNPMVAEAVLATLLSASDYLNLFDEQGLVEIPMFLNGGWFGVKPAREYVGDRLTSAFATGSITADEYATAKDKLREGDDDAAQTEA